MESRNPVFNSSKEFKRGGYATFRANTPSAAELDSMYGAPSATAAQMGRMTLDDVVVRAGTLFAVLLTTAAVTFAIVKPTSVGLVLGAMLVALVLALVAQLGGKPRPAVMLAYAALEGVVVGGVSYWYSSFYGSQLVPQAVLGTLAAFGAMLFLYKSGRVRNSPKFTRTLMIAGVGYLAFGLLNLLLSAFHVGGYQNVYAGGSMLGLALSAFGVVLASFFLVLDFDFIDQGIRNGLPRAYAWTAAFGLVVTLVWLYLEMLRLLAILQGGRR
jgi:uncharacterized YccA/Bax inhibitor family protein